MVAPFTAWTVNVCDPLDKGGDRVKAQGLPNNWIKRGDVIRLRRRYDDFLDSQPSVNGAVGGTL